MSAATGTPIDISPLLDVELGAIKTEIAANPGYVTSAYMVSKVSDISGKLLDYLKPYINSSISDLQSSGLKAFFNIAVNTVTSVANVGAGTYSASSRILNFVYDVTPRETGYAILGTPTYSAPPDTTPPSTPIGLAATAVSSGQINLSWTASTDNVGVAGYKIYRGGSLIANQATISYSDTGLSPSTQYCYTVSAYDAANNESAQSGAQCATTTAPPPSVRSFVIGGTVTGLTGSVVLRDNGGDNLTVSASGTFTFPTMLTSGSAYSVTVFTQPSGQNCAVTSGSGTATANVTGVAVSCSNNSSLYVYVANSGDGTVSQYTIGTGGVLTPIIPATVAAGINPLSVTVDAQGRYAYVANSSSNNISQYTIGTGGELTPIIPSTISTGAGPYSITIDPSGKYAYVSDANSNGVQQYTVGTGGALTAMPTPQAITCCLYNFSVTVDPLSRYAYVANEANSEVWQYTIDVGGALIAMTPAWVATGPYPYSVTVDPLGRYAYATSSSNGTISQYIIGAGGALTPMSPATVAVSSNAASTNLTSIIVDPSGRYAYVTNYSYGIVLQYTIGAGGILTPMTPATVTAGTGPWSVTIDSSGQYAYVANVIDGTISQYTIGTSGALTPMTPATVAAGARPVSIITAK